MEILSRFGWDGDDGMGDDCVLKNHISPGQFLEIGRFHHFIISSAVVLGGLDSIEV